MELAEIVEVGYTFSEADVATYFEDINANATTRQRFKAGAFTKLCFYLYLIGIPALVYLGISMITDSFLAAFVPMALVASQGRRSLKFIMKRRLLHKMRSHKGSLGQHHIQFTEHGFLNRSQTMEWTLFWPHIDDIVVTRHHILVIGSKDVGQLTCPIPLHAFQSREDAEAFLKNASSLWKQGHMSTGALPEKF